MELVIEFLEKELNNIIDLNYKPILKEFNDKYIQQLKKAIEILKNENNNSNQRRS